ncbi:hypothetical protein C469_00750 [Halorubrum lipolyticum DSM 21995]|uniref:Uncharacterized protein n=1 Tax=Halorubrum lipolyticum DSM 21995 TaxID=1227482 RepID=M0P7C1_9EURY|nr:hypothetical protein C469_00750 [Halorubrum lipolyticum DSM 21995]
MSTRSVLVSIEVLKQGLRTTRREPHIIDALLFRDRWRDDLLRKLLIDLFDTSAVSKEALERSELFVQRDGLDVLLATPSLVSFEVPTAHVGERTDTTLLTELDEVL